ncbi:MAG TPA: TatD family hydrolase [Spirochaetota bacterium]|nr:TatD family hydrolase [Spirochaetota bacterium]
MIIDFHTHIFPEEICLNRENFFSDSSFRLLYDDRNSTLASYSQLSQYLQRAEISGAVAMAFPWGSEYLCKLHNDYMSDVASRYKNIYPFGILPREKIRSIFAMAESIKKSKLYGIGEVALYEDGLTDNNLKYLHRVFEAAEYFNLPLCIHLNEPLGHSYRGKYITPFEKIYHLIKNFPKTTVILSHWGGGILFYELMPEVKECFKKVYYDTAASPFIYDNEIYSTSIRIVGHKKILFGTDFPLLSEKRYLPPIYETGEEFSSDILGNNCAEILNLKI